MRASPYPMLPPPSNQPQPQPQPQSQEQFYQHPLHPHYAHGGYTLPPSAAFFPMSAYSAAPLSGVPHPSRILDAAVMGGGAGGVPGGCGDSSADGLTQPNTPDLLMHRRQVKNGLM